MCGSGLPMVHTLGKSCLQVSMWHSSRHEAVQHDRPRVFRPHASIVPVSFHVFVDGPCFDIASVSGNDPTLLYAVDVVLPFDYCYAFSYAFSFGFRLGINVDAT